MDYPPISPKGSSRRLSDVDRSTSHRLFRKYFSNGGFQEAEWSATAGEALKRCLTGKEEMAAKCARVDDAVAVSEKNDIEPSTSQESIFSLADGLRNLLDKCRVEASLNAKALKNCIGEKKDVEGDRDLMAEEYEDMLYKSGDLDLEIKELRQEKEYLRTFLRLSEQKVKELTEIRNILDEENKCLKMQLSRESHQQGLSASNQHAG